MHDTASRKGTLHLVAFYLFAENRNTIVFDHDNAGINQAQ